jgi:hypothetical protein
MKKLIGLVILLMSANNGHTTEIDPDTVFPNGGTIEAGEIVTLTGNDERELSHENLTMTTINGTLSLKDESKIILNDRAQIENNNKINLSDNATIEGKSTEIINNDTLTMTGSSHLILNNEFQLSNPGTITLEENAHIKATGRSSIVNNGVISFSRNANIILDSLAFLTNTGELRLAGNSFIKIMRTPGTSTPGLSNRVDGEKIGSIIFESEDSNSIIHNYEKIEFEAGTKIIGKGTIINYKDFSLKEDTDFIPYENMSNKTYYTLMTSEERIKGTPQIEGDVSIISKCSDIDIERLLTLKKTDVAVLATSETTVESSQPKLYVSPIEETITVSTNIANNSNCNTTMTPLGLNVTGKFKFTGDNSYFNSEKTEVVLNKAIVEFIGEKSSYSIFLNSYRDTKADLLKFIEGLGLDSSIIYSLPQELISGVPSEVETGELMNTLNNCEAKASVEQIKKDGLFQTPITVTNGSTMTITYEEEANLNHNIVVEKDSQLIITPGTKVITAKGATLHIKAGGSFIVN